MPPLGEWTTDHFEVLVSKLRASGFPEGVIRQVVGTVLEHHFRARSTAEGLRAVRDPTHFWQSPVVRTDSGTPEQIAGRRALERERRDLARTLLGPDYELSEDERLRRTHGLPPDTAASLHRILADYRELAEEARDQPASQSEVAAKLALLEKEKRADLERLLTPEQLIEFDLRMGAGSGLHRRLGSFAVTEAEFRALYAAQKEFESSHPDLRSRERSVQFEPEIRRVLGEARYAELLVTNEHGAQLSRAFMEARAFVVEHDLAPSVASDILALQERFRPQLNVVNQTLTLTAEQKQAARATVATAARTELLRLLGPTAFAAYERTRGDWLPPTEAGPP